ncbi:polysaccharide biosynthesis tyrosine autokinase [Scytonema sp. UIC 10036]|uniref:GumC family protein n=1 Tax=Scytonema sp. UIC 10036 TaxID=2304196 RepID=UPI0012DAB044|nr:polysaccharide biosynthesis tyrosine autokinase [Scytonema sp. UIC 10036]MUG96870.1 polysaccharide biosynthesis tyrosine autokinase [Scytonema sp. UIC 10036]
MPTKKHRLQELTQPNVLSRELYGFWKRSESDEDNAGLGPILAVLRRQWALIASISAITIAVSILWTVTRTPKYEGKIQLLVEPLQTSDSQLLVLLSETLKQNINEITRQNNTSLDYRALMEVLKSPKLLNPVVNELKSRYPDISYDKLVGNDVVGKLPKAKKGTLYIERIVIGKEKEDRSRVIEVRYRETDPEKIQAVLNKVSKAYQNYSREQQQTNLRQGIRFVERQIPILRQRVNFLQEQLQTFQQQYGVFEPQLQGEQLLKQVDELRALRIDTAEKLATARSLLTSLQKQLGLLANEAIAASALSESPQYQQILTRVREIEARIAAESTRFTGSNPVMLSLQEQRQKLLPLLEQEAEIALGHNSSSTKFTSEVRTYQNTVRRDLTKQLADVTNQIQYFEASLTANNQATLELERRIKQYPAIARQHNNLQRELQAATDTLNQLLAKQEALRVDAAQQEIPWETILPPTLPRNKNGKLIPVSPKPILNIGLGGFVGVLLGVFAAFVRENIQNVFYDPKEIKRTTKLSLLGVVPFDKRCKLSTKTDAQRVHRQQQNSQFLPKVIANENSSASPFIQVFYSIYNHLSSLRADTPVRSLVVTSAMSGEGKSTIAINVARTAAQSGLRVLLVDANLGHPTIHTMLGLVNSKGLSEVITQGLELDDVLGQAPREDNLFIVVAGEKTHNTAKLFSSKKFELFMERSQTKFDLVIYDAPPVIGVLDTNLLARRTHGVLFVVGLGKTTQSCVQQALDELKVAHVPVLGAIANTANN